MKTYGLTHTMSKTVLNNKRPAMNNYLTPGAKNQDQDTGNWDFDVNFILKSIFSIGEDGVNHINMSDEGQTELGRMLAHTSRLPFTHSHYGHFNTMNNFWYYIRSVERDDRLRSFYGKRLKTFLKTNTTHCRIPNFRVIIMDANWQRVQQHPLLATALKDSGLPLDCWYRYRRENGLRLRPNFAFWLIAGFEEIRKALKENREPDFDFLRDTKDTDVFETADKAVKSIAQ